MTRCLSAEFYTAGALQTVVEAMEALHTLVCYTNYSFQLMELHMTDIFKPLLQALQPHPLPAQLTFGASLACMAAQAHSFDCQDVSKKDFKDPRMRLGPSAVCNSIQHNATLDVICSCIQDALLVQWRQVSALCAMLCKLAHVTVSQNVLLSLEAAMPYSIDCCVLDGKLRLGLWMDRGACLLPGA